MLEGDELTLAQLEVYPDEEVSEGSLRLAECETPAASRGFDEASAPYIHVSTHTSIHMSTDLRLI